MAYTPELSQIGSAILRRLAWHLQKPMTKSLEVLIELTAMKMAEVRPGEVCNKCRDDSICEWCPFHTPSTFYRNL
jgi:recombinational DNA repair protein RecR